MRLTRIMVDLETLSTGPTALIVSIGAATFGGGEERVFYAAVDPDSDLLGHISASTVKWWARQSEAARNVFSDPFKLRSCVALERFSEWVRGFDDVEIWGNGADFDNVVLRSAFERMGHVAPWSHRQNRCYRTLRSLAPEIPFEPHGTAHNALDDAIAQARHAGRILDALRGDQK